MNHHVEGQTLVKAHVSRHKNSKLQPKPPASDF